jgi:hypothetical protein
VSNQYEYFLAPSGEAAAETIEWVGGPSRRPSGERGYPTLVMPGIEPTVTLGIVDELLNDRTFEEVLEDASSVTVAERPESWVIALTTALQDGLALARDERLHDIASSWVQHEEFGGLADAADASAALVELAKLARMGRDQGQRIYCWVTL